jgi:hypothetical protein
MPELTSTPQPGEQDLRDLLRRLEERVDRIEAHLEIRSRPEGAKEGSATPLQKAAMADSESLEFRIGEYWLARLGSVVLLIGMAFLISYPFTALPATLISLVGYMVVAGVFGLSLYWHKTYQDLAKILYGGALVLFYFATLRLHFFNPNPLLAGKTAGLMAVVVALAIVYYLALRRQSAFLTGLALFLAYATALISDTSHFALLLILATSVAGAYVLIRFGWRGPTVMSVILAYASYLLWIANNPLLGKPLQAIADHHNALPYLFLYGSCFAVANLLQQKTSYSEYMELLLAGLNSVGLFALASLTILTFHKPQLALLYFFVAIYFIIFAIVKPRPCSPVLATSP